MLKVVVNTGDLSDKLDKLPEAVKDALRQEAESLVGELLADIRGRFGSVFKVVDGSYLGSIQSRVKVNPKSVVGAVFTKAEFAGVDEWGGHLPAHDIAPKSARALHFLDNSADVFAGLVHNPGANIKPHPLWHDVFVSERDDIVARLVTAATMRAASDINAPGE